MNVIGYKRGEGLLYRKMFKERLYGRSPSYIPKFRVGDGGGVMFTNISGRGLLYIAISPREWGHNTTPAIRRVILVKKHI